MVKNLDRFQIVFIIAVLAASLLVLPVSAFETRSGDNIVIDKPIDDDLLASGGSLIVNAPVKSITWAGGTLIVNEPVKTNVIAAGGTIQLNAPVGTDLIAAGGNIDINGNVDGKILAAGGSVTMNGNTENIVATGGTVILGKNAVISRDARISASGYTTQATIKGNLTVEDERNTHSGMSFLALKEAFNTIISLIMLLCFIGFLILGILLMKLCPGFFATVTDTGRKQILLSIGAGIIGIIGSFVLFVILLITVIGIPIALFMMLLVIAALMISTIVAGGVFGSWILEKAGKNTGLVWGFVIGFIILNILFFIPFLGFIIWLVALFLGFGAMLLTFYQAMKNPDL
ncbi:MAG: hemagglutinin repeat-containing protein [Methanospirillum sp.]|nr:hemagglutinin repeat-containing protein [Methanospirillum sp.]